MDGTYRAFISYSSKNRWFAWRLHRALEAYRVPVSIKSAELEDDPGHSWLGRIVQRTLALCQFSDDKIERIIRDRFRNKHKLGKFFRDRDDLPPSNNLSDILRCYLEKSRNLIVVCSPDSAKSPHVNEEILEFKKLGREQKIFAISIDGKINNNEKYYDKIGQNLNINQEIEDLEFRDSFPPSLFYSMDNEGFVIKKANQPKALKAEGFFSKFFISRYNRILLIAGLLGIEPDELWVRERRRTRARRIIGSLGALFTILISSALYVHLAINQSHRLSLQNSARIAETVEQAIADGWDERALRLGILAARESTFKRAAPEATSALARAAKESRIVGELRGHAQPLTSVAFSIDGKRIFTTSMDGTARLWNSEKQEQIPPKLDHGGLLSLLKTSPDGKTIVTASGDGTAKIWNADDGMQTGKTIEHEYAITALAFSPDGDRFATGSLDQTVKLWNPSTGQHLGSAMHHRAGIVVVTFSPDGRWLVAATQFGEIQIWNASTGAKAPAQIPFVNDRDPTQMGMIGALAISPDSKILATGRNPANRTNSLIHFWDLETGQIIGESLELDNHITFGDFSPDGTIFATTDATGEARFWSVDDRTVIGKPMRHDQQILRVAFDPNGTKLATADASGMVRLWDARTGDPIGAPFRHDHPIWDIAFSPNGDRLASASYNIAKIWDVNRAEELRGETLVQDVCENDLLGQDQQELDVRGHTTGRVTSIRRLTAADVKNIPLLRDRVGDDVCEAPSFWEEARDALIQAAPRMW